MSGADQRKRDISRFLELCVIYSDDSLARKQKRMGELNEKARENLEVEIAKWQAFSEFCDYAIDELTDGKLDEWLERLHDPDFHPLPHE